jgi:predicted flap endonuclease-1-like 5' DNA nuclease
MTIKVNEIRGIAEQVADALKAHGVNDSDHLLAMAKTPTDRTALSQKLGISTAEVLNLANRADLARVKGIGRVYADLLEMAGVDTVKELATRNPDNLHEKLVSLMDDAPAVSRPSAETVAEWIAHAKQLGAGLEY